MEMPVESKDDVKILLHDQAAKEENASGEEQPCRLNDPADAGRVGRPLEREDMEVEMAVAGGEGKSLVFSISNDDMLRGDMDCIPFACSSCSISDDESLSRAISWSSRCSESLSSEDEDLIEIAVPDGHYIERKESNALWPRSAADFLPNFLPEAVFRQHGLMELLSEINEDDNLIEIDIVMGSIKCSSLGINA
ncbi:uncharacterized protein LOC120106125 isoform X2 [Phoenix dactylifera]|nr:uncharacterized protein LOC120106125 isoform X2 [Phoenix dactylifera]